MMDHPAPEPLLLQPDISDLSRLTAYIEEFAETHELALSDTMAITLAAEELFANTIHHSRTPVTFISFAMVAHNGVVTSIYTDDASAFDPTQKTAPDTTLPAEARDIGGLGIHLIRKTMALFRYERVGNKNVITFARQNHDD